MKGLGVGPSGLKICSRYSFHALTDVAIEYRPFGPEIPEDQLTKLSTPCLTAQLNLPVIFNRLNWRPNSFYTVD